jgi:hypothetical protein
MDQQANEQKPRSTEGGKVKWSDKTRGGYWVRGVEQFRNDFTGIIELSGQVGNHSHNLPSDDPNDWSRETWSSDGRYYTHRECVFDLVKVGE